MKTTKLIKRRFPTDRELKEHEYAEVAFERQDDNGRTHIIFGCTCYESWSQWGVAEKILGDNVDEIEEWRQGQPYPQRPSSGKG